MIGLIQDARRGVTGVLLTLVFRPDYRDHFDISARGVIRSFGAALLAIPIVAFNTLVHNTLAAHEAATVVDPSEVSIHVFPLSFTVVNFLAQWGYFPFLAYALTRLLGRPEALASWIVAVNWAHLLSISLLLLPHAVMITGPVILAVPLLNIYVVVLVFSYTRAAIVSLQTSLPVALGAALAHLMVWLLVSEGLRRLFHVSATAS